MERSRHFCIENFFAMFPLAGPGNDADADADFPASAHGVCGTPRYIRFTATQPANQGEKTSWTAQQPPSGKAI